MNTKTVLNVKTDKKLKEQAQKVSRELGVPMSVLVNNYLRQLIQTKSAYFSVDYKKEIPRPEVARRWAKIDEDIKKGRNMSPAFSNMKDALAWLKSK